jgi:hypothetical protein
MLYKTKSLRGRRVRNARQIAQVIPNQLAQALIGQTVSLLDHAHNIAHGVVAGVLIETGRPKLVVGRVQYDLSQVLSVTPPAFN